MFIVKCLGYLACLYLVALAGLYFLQRSVLYHPENFYLSPAEAHADPRFQEVTLHTEDGLKITSWYAPASTKDLTIVFFHGNADQLRTVATIASPYIKAGYGFMAAEYRGYSGQPGRPTEQGLYNDGRAALTYLKQQGVGSGHVVLFGQSLGTGVAVEMAKENRVAGVILASAYLSIGKVAQAKYPMFPAEILTKDRFESFKKIQDVRAPLLMFHGQLDTVVPVDQGQELFKLANEPKTFHLFETGGHNDVFQRGVFPLSFEWLEQLEPAAGGS